MEEIVYPLKRIGKFEIAWHLICSEKFDILRLLMGRCFVLQATRNMDEIQYIAVHNFFDEIEDGQIISNYEIIFEQGDDDILSARFVKQDSCPACGKRI